MIVFFSWTLQSLIYLSFLYGDVSGINGGWTQTHLPANSIVDIVGAACSLSGSRTCAIVGNQVIPMSYPIHLSKLFLFLFFSLNVTDIRLPVFINT